MIARLIVFESNGGRRTHRLSVHAKLANQHELKLAMETSAEPFEPWLFFFLRDHGSGKLLLVDLIVLRFVHLRRLARPALAHSPSRGSYFRSW